jgi:hypothetical protein
MKITKAAPTKRCPPRCHRSRQVGGHGYTRAANRLYRLISRGKTKPAWSRALQLAPIYSCGGHGYTRAANRHIGVVFAKSNHPQFWMDIDTLV